MKQTSTKITVVAMAFLVFSSCSKDETVVKETLYTRLGGVDAISAVVDKFLTFVVPDTRINAFFAATVASPSRTQLLRNNLIDQIGEAAGGPLKYKGKSMVASHTGMNITKAQFNALVEDLVLSLNFFKVPAAEQTELLTILGGLESQIVGK